MTNQTIDNSADEQFGNVILWQYDKAVNLCSFINELKTFFNSTTKNIWDEMLSEINVDDATDFGLSILGTLIGCPRPDGISTELYRRILKARFTLMMSNYSVYDINKYLKSVFSFFVEYNSKRTYSIGDICEHENKFYECTTAILSPGEDWDEEHWSEIEEYSDENTYEENDICIHNGILFICISDIEEPELWNEEHWKYIELIPSVNDGGDITYYPDRKYMVGDICVNDGTLYVCTTQIGAPGEEWNPSHWNEIEEYSASGTYEAGDVCIYNGGFYRCTTPIETPEEWTSGHWAEIRFVKGYSPMTLAWGIDDSEMSDEAKSLVEDYPELVFNYPAGVFDGSILEHVIFGFDGQQQVETTDPKIGGLDDSNFIYASEETKYIPENERIVS